MFHVYLAGSEGPVVFCLHGGGYSGYVAFLEIYNFHINHFGFAFQMLSKILAK